MQDDLHGQHPDHPALGITFFVHSLRSPNIPKILRSTQSIERRWIHVRRSGKFQQGSRGRINTTEPPTRPTGAARSPGPKAIPVDATTGTAGPTASVERTTGQPRELDDSRNFADSQQSVTLS